MTLQQSWYARDTRGWTCEPPDGGAAEFHRALPGYAATPLVESPALAAGLGVGRLFIKDESARFDLRAFKFLGASWAGFRAVAARTGYAGPATLDALRAHLAAGAAAVSGGPGDGGAARSGAARGGAIALVTATDGNHGRAVARTARLLGLPARVYVPKTVPGLVIDRIGAEGATVTVVDADYDGAVDAARADADGRADPGGGAGAEGSADPAGSAGAGGSAGPGGSAGAGGREEAGAVLIQDTAWPGYEQVPGWIVAGYETLFAELDAQLAVAGADGGGPLVLGVPVGVGSLAQAAVAHYRSRVTGARSRARLLSVEPDTAACVLRSLTAGTLVSVPTDTTVMNGLNCGTPSSLAWPYLRDGMDAAIAVTDGEARAAIAALASAGVSAGPSGAAAWAGLLAALTGAGTGSRRRDLGLGGETGDDRATVVCLSTEGPLSV